jgi:hypothetical protein
VAWQHPAQAYNISISQVEKREPTAWWIVYLFAESIIPFVMVVSTNGSTVGQPMNLA